MSAPATNVYRLPAPRRAAGPWVRKAVVCEHFGVSERTVERWMREGMPRRKLPRSRSVRFQIAAVEAWIIEQESA